MTDIVTQNSAEVQALMAQQEAEYEGMSFQTPILKVCQPLTKEVSQGEAEAGDFLNTLTGESLGTQIEFIVAFYERGRSASDKDTRQYYVTQSNSIPENWGKLLGDQWVGKPFTEHPDAEELFKERVNAKEIQWGSGPLISTTYNFTGLVVVPEVEGEDDEDGPQLQPVRLTLQRTGKKTADKILSLKRMMMHNKPFWAKAFDLSTVRKDYDKGSAYNVNVKIGRAAEAYEQEFATQLALALTGGRVNTNDDASEERTAAPAAQGGLEV